MGSTASKPTETRVFTPSSQINISPNLVNQLESSIETDYIRSQYTEKYLQEEVSKRLEDVSTKTDGVFKATLKDVIATKDDKPEISSKGLSAKIDELSKKLNDKKSKILELNDEVLNKKKEIVSCLSKNEGKPLNCWDEVKSFEKLVNELK